MLVFWSRAKRHKSQGSVLQSFFKTDNLSIRIFLCWIDMPISRLIKIGCVGGLAVIVLAFFSHDPSSNLCNVLHFFVVICRL